MNDKYIVNQSMNSIRLASACSPISMDGCQILGTGHQSLADEDALSVLEHEDKVNAGLKVHTVELGLYSSPEQTRIVFWRLMNWLDEPNDRIFVMPEVDEDGGLIWCV